LSVEEEGLEFCMGVALQDRVSSDQEWFEIARQSLEEMKAFREFDRARRREEKLKMNQLQLPSHGGMGSAVGPEVVHRLKRRSARFQEAALREEEVEMNGGAHFAVTDGVMQNGSNLVLSDIGSRNSNGMRSEHNGFDDVFSAIDTVNNLDFQNENGDTALMVACGSRKQDGGNANDDVVAAILDKGGSVNLRNKDGMTALMFAAMNGDEAIVRRLCQHAAKLEVKGIKNTKTALLFAAENGHRKVVETLLSFGATFTTISDDDGANILMLCVNNNQIDTIQFVLRYNEESLMKSKQIDIDHQNKLGYTALMIAAYNGNQRVVQMLLDHGANRQIKNNGGESAYALARKAQHMELCQLLI